MSQKAVLKVGEEFLADVPDAGNTVLRRQPGAHDAHLEDLKRQLAAMQADEGIEPEVEAEDDLLEAEVEAEDEAPEGVAGDDPTTTEQPERKTVPTDQSAEDQPAEPIMVPKGRLDEELEKRRKAEAETAYLRGQIDALQRGQTAAPAAPSIDVLQKIDADLQVLAERFDAGEITTSDFVKQQAELMRQQTVEVVRRTAPPAQPGDDLYLEAETTKLFAEFPALADYDIDELQQISQLVMSKRAKEGKLYATKPDQSLTPAAVLEHRRHVAEYAQRISGSSAPPPAPAPTPEPAPTAEVEKPRPPKAPGALFTPSPQNHGARQIDAAMEAVAGIPVDRLQRMSSRDFDRLARTNPAAFRKIAEHFDG